MAYEIDPDEDQAASSAPAAGAPAVAASPSPSAPAPSNAGSRFVGFDQLLSLNRPSAEQTASSLASGANQQIDAATKAVGQDAELFKGATQKGISAAGYQGPNDVAGAFSNARGLASDAYETSQALGSAGGTQALLQRQGQSSDAARYNGLFASAVGQPQAQATQDRFKGFDDLLSGAYKRAGSDVDFAQTMSRYAAYEQGERAKAAEAWAKQQEKDKAAKDATAAQTQAERDAFEKYRRAQPNPLNPRPGYTPFGGFP